MATQLLSSNIGHSPTFTALSAQDSKALDPEQESHTYHRDELPEFNSKPSTQNKWQKFIKVAKIWAKIFDSRTSTNRAVMDFFGADIPTILGGMRNIYSFCEALMEGCLSFIMVFASPLITKTVAKLLSKFFLAKGEQKDILNHLLFHRDELHDNDRFLSAISRIRDEEVRDQGKIAELYQQLGKDNKVQEFIGHSKRIKDYCQRFTDEYLAKDTEGNLEFNSNTDSQRKKILKLKEIVLLGESLIEGGIWGSYGLGLRLFRKYILRQDSFTGTKGYTTKEQRQKIGDSSKLGRREILGGLLGMLISPITNSILLTLTKNRDKVNKNKLLSIIDSQLDMNHSLYPKLGLIFSYMTYPKWFSVFFTTQGRNELIERVTKFLSMAPIWYLGHRVTNGMLAAKRDQDLVKQYGLEPGILVDRTSKVEPGLWGWLDHIFPKASKFFDVDSRIAHLPNPKLQDKILNQHARTVYEGIGLQSLIMFIAISISQWMTKLRVKKSLATT